MKNKISKINSISLLIIALFSFQIYGEEITSEEANNANTDTNVSAPAVESEASLKMPVSTSYQIDLSSKDYLGTGLSLTKKKTFGRLSTTTTSFTDAYLSGDSSAFGLGTTALGVPANYISRPCKDKNGEVKSEFVLLTKSSDELNRAVTCNDDVKYLGYDDCSCVQYESCTKAVLGIDNFFGFKMTSHYKNIIQPYVGEGLGKKYAEKLIDKELNNIEELKLLRKYAEKIGVNVADENSCENQNASGDCRPSEVDGIIYNKQKACGIASKINCYNVEDSEYKNIEIAEDSKEIRYNLYLNKIAENKAVELMTYELSVGNEIADLFLEKDKKKSAKGAMKLTQAQLKEKLNVLNNQKKLDPVLAYVLKDEGRLSQFYNKMNGLFKSQKTPSQSFFKDAISAYRKETLDNVFSPSSCSQKTSLNKICEMKVSIANASKNKIPTMTSTDIANMFDSDDNFENEFANYKAQSMFRVIGNANEYAAMVKGYRCFMLKYDFTKGKVKKPTTCGFYSQAPVSEEDSIYSVGSRSSTSTENNSSGPDGSSIEKDNSKIDIGSLNIEGVKKDDHAMSDKIESASTIDLNKAMTETMNSNFANATIPTEEVVNSNIHSEEVNLYPSNVPVASNESKQEKSPAALLEEKLKELNNKISAAEQMLNNIKNKKDDDSKIIKDSAQDEQAKNLEAQIKQLKSDLAIAKQKMNNPIEKIETAPSRSVASSTPSASVSPRELNEERRVFNQDSASKHEVTRDTARSISDAASGGATSAVVNAGASSAVAQSRVGGLVLTKVDGLSSDALVETITAKISELSGQPFLIEEGGYVKEIIPVIKDGKVVLDNKGKPMFEKIIKGKVADLKLKDSKRAPAAVSSQAELRKAEEVKVKIESDRLKYKNLREITNEAVK